MLTIFSTPKPFRGHIDVIQRNAIQSWLKLDPNVEVILFGDEPGAAEIAREFGFRHVAEVRRSETGTKYLNHLFESAQRLASNDVVCYVNCDIILPGALTEAITKVVETKRPFLIVGRRWDTDITEPIDFSNPGWERQADELRRTRGKRQTEWFADYFVFSRGLYRDMPPLVIGRNAWDNWLIWRALDLGAVVVDASKAVRAIHQNHDYGYHPGGKAGVIYDAQTWQNYAIAGKGKYIRTIGAASYRFDERGLRRFYFSEVLFHTKAVGRAIPKRISWAWYRFLSLTRPIRHPIKTYRGA